MWYVLWQNQWVNYVSFQHPTSLFDSDHVCCGCSSDVTLPSWEVACNLKKLGSLLLALGNVKHLQTLQGSRNPEVPQKITIPALNYSTQRRTESIWSVWSIINPAPCIIDLASWNIYWDFVFRVCPMKNKTNLQLLLLYIFEWPLQR